MSQILWKKVEVEKWLETYRKISENVGICDKYDKEVKLSLADGALTNRDLYFLKKVIKDDKCLFSDNFLSKI